MDRATMFEPNEYGLAYIHVLVAVVGAGAKFAASVVCTASLPKAGPALRGY